MGAQPHAVVTVAEDGTVTHEPYPSKRFTDSLIEIDPATARSASESEETVGSPGDPEPGGSTIDLTITAMSASCNGDGTLAVSTTVRNLGSSDSGSFEVGIYASTNSIISTADTRIAWASPGGGAGLGPGGSSNIGGNITAANAAPGVYYIGAYADDTFTVSETDEDNNTLAEGDTATLPCSAGEPTIAVTPLTLTFTNEDADRVTERVGRGATDSPALPLYHLGSDYNRIFGVVAAAVDGLEIAIDTVGLATLPPALTLELLDGTMLTATRTDGEKRGPGSVLWRGLADGRRVVLTLESGLVAGRIESGKGTYQIVPMPGGGHGLAHLDEALFPPCDGGIEPPARSVAETPPTFNGTDPADRIDVLAVYTPQARDAAGGVAAIQTTIQNAVDVTNTAFIDSNMIARFNLVHTALANHNDSGSSGTDLSWVANDATVAALRDTYAADMVSLITENGGGGCGRAYVMRNPSSSFASSAFQVTARGCAVGNLTWAHEHGHNMGFEHDPANGVPPSSASYDWSFGHFIDGSYRTVMSYSSQCTMGCSRVAHFSNPAVNHLGAPTGITDQRDNHRSGNLTASIVANFRSSTGQVLTISNTGTGTLTVTSITAESPASWISWSPQAPFAVAPGSQQSITVSVDFDTAPAGQTTNRLVIESNDSDLSPYPGGVTINIDNGIAPDAIDRAGVYRPSNRLFQTDNDGSGTLTQPTDQSCQLGTDGDVPLAGDWNGDGKDELGVYRPSTRQFLLDQNGDCALNFGAGGDVGCTFFSLDGEPIIGDWNGDGDDDIGIYRDRLFRMDLDESCSWNAAGDDVALFGLDGDTPIIGDWNGDGDDDIGIYRPSNRVYLMDLDESGTWNPPGDRGCLFGLLDDTPIIGDWNNDNSDQIGSYRPPLRMFLMDRDDNCQWSLQLDLWAIFGQTGDQPLIGNW
ncbi:MAG: M12 family metallo-peptidase [Acidobacteriota bacterium]